MDEYLGDDMEWIAIDHPLSFRGFMERTVYSKIKPELNVPEEQRVFPDPNNLEYIPNLIEKLGGEVAGCVYMIELAGLEGRKKLEGYRVEAAICYEGK